MRSVEGLLVSAIVAGLVLLGAGPALAQQPTDAQDLQVLLQMLPAKQQLDALTQAGRHKEAEAVARQMLETAERAFPHRPEFVVPFLNNLAVIYTNQGRLTDAEPIQERVVAVLEKAYGVDAPAVAVVRRNLAGVRLALGRYPEAEAGLRRVLESHQRQPIFDNSGLSTIWNELGLVHFHQGKYPEAEAEHRQALALMEQARGPEDPEIAAALNNLGNDLETTQRLPEAEALYRRALEVTRRRYGLENPNAATFLGNLGRVISSQGRSAEAEPLLKQALQVVEKLQGADSLATAVALGNVGTFYLGQNRESDAEPIFERIVAIYGKAGVPEHPNLADPMTVLAMLRLKAGREAEAHRLFQRALAIREKTWGPDHPQIILALFSQALLHLKEALDFTGRLTTITTAVNLRELLVRPGPFDPVRPTVAFTSLLIVRHRFAQAEAIFRRALAIQERVWGAESPQAAFLLSMVAMLDFWLGRADEVIRLEDRAIAISERAGSLPGSLAQNYQWRSRALWLKGRRDDALLGMRRALDLAERERSQGSGGAFDQARHFGMFSNVFDQMVAFQSQVGDAAEALSAAERGRARALLDQIALQGTDLLAGLPAERAAPLRQDREQAQTRVAELTARLGALERAPGPFGPDKRREADALNMELNQARSRLIEAEREIHNLSPAARLAQAADRKPVPLDRLRATLARSGALLLEYVIGEEGAYVIVVPGSGAPARVQPLTVSPAAALRLGGTTAPMIEIRLQKALVGTGADGVLPLLSRREATSEPDPRLAALWDVLVPEPERRDLLAGRYRHLVIVPDAALSLLPFEALVVEEGREPKYLLDAGPPISYAPSATLYQNLVDRPTAGPAPDREPVLALGDPAYGEAGAADPAPTHVLAARSRYSGVGGRLTRLPHSGLEARWVTRVYGDHGIRAGMLDGANATERGLRYWAPGRRVLHVACHGRANEQFGNFFGALALTPGPGGSDPADDGFLTLSEINELNLKGCELAILSACQTNYGPQQKGEGTWALSRGFLVAGTRRVVASNWLVDDEAAASLVSYFCAGLAQAEKAGQPIDHAEALQAARRWVRQQEKWKSPYYWASMVLIGPP